MSKFYSVRVVEADNYEEAVEKVELNDFDETDETCDVILTHSQLLAALGENY